MTIATTIIPWTSEWLLFFEYWQISGEFLGPGRHPPRRRNECPKPPETSDPATRARRERFRNDEFHRIGRKTGVFGSYLWMGAALRDCSLQPVLAELERRYLGGGSIAGYFDLVAGTSTGGIIALGLGAGLTASHLAELYAERGADIFPTAPTRQWPHSSLVADSRHFLLYHYERNALENLLLDALGDKLRRILNRALCIPAFEGKHSEVFVFKTPHHPDYKFDRFEPMVKWVWRPPQRRLTSGLSSTTATRWSTEASGQTTR